MMNSSTACGIQSSAGAVSVRNEKGELSMKKVKVCRYFSGKRPDYAQDYSDYENDDDDFIERHSRALSLRAEKGDDDDMNDPRMRRIKMREADTEIGSERKRHVHEAEVLKGGDDENDKNRMNLLEPKHTLEISDGESEGELSDAEIESRRELLKRRVLGKQEEQELALEEDEKLDLESSESSEYEEYTDSEEDAGPRFKPVFVCKRDRITIVEKKNEAQRLKQFEQEAQKQAEERRRRTVKMVEESIKKEQLANNKEDDEPNLNDVCTDEEDDEIEYEMWTLRELKRIKRDREEREAMGKERLEIDRMRNMTEEERKIDSRLNPKDILNKPVKGKYRFLQKYYHRGAFYLDKEEEVLKRDFSQATLEDHFDKTALPDVLQVKNFGRSGRTKYTHLVDQDTTQFDSPWFRETTQSTKFYSSRAGGMRQTFDKPTSRKRKCNRNENVCQ